MVCSVCRFLDQMLCNCVFGMELIIFSLYFTVLCMSFPLLVNEVKNGLFFPRTI